MAKWNGCLAGLGWGGWQAGGGASPKGSGNKNNIEIYENRYIVVDYDMILFVMFFISKK